MATLPSIGASDGTWPQELNSFLSVFFRSNGTPRITWCKVSIVSGSYELTNGLNVSSISSTVDGQVVVVFSEAISAGASAFIATCQGVNAKISTVSARSKTSVQVNTFDDAGTLDKQGFCLLCLEK